MLLFSHPTSRLFPLSEITMNNLHRIMALSLAAALGAMGLAPSAHAAYTTTVAGAGLSSTDGNATTHPFDITENDNPNGSKPLVGSGFALRETIGAGAQIDAFAGGDGSASASAGILRAKLSTNAYTLDGILFYPRVTASFGASFVDTVTLTAPAGSGLLPGDPVSYTVRWTLDGVTNSPYYYSGYHYPLGRLSASFSVYDGADIKAGTGFNLPPYEGYTLSALYNIDIPYVVSGFVGDSLTVSASIGLASDNRSGSTLDGAGTQYGDQSTLLDFSNTMHLYLDPITPGLGFAAQSTHDYSSNAPADVPEPATLGFFALGAAILFTRRR
jgi:hypothetical protein